MYAGGPDRASAIESSSLDGRNALGSRQTIMRRSAAMACAEVDVVKGKVFV
jgi:hypothetical protein